MDELAAHAPGSQSTDVDAVDFRALHLFLFLLGVGAVIWTAANAYMDYGFFSPVSTIAKIAAAQTFIFMTMMGVIYTLTRTIIVERLKRSRKRSQAS